MLLQSPAHSICFLFDLQELELCHVSSVKNCNISMILRILAPVEIIIIIIVIIIIMIIIIIIIMIII